MTLDELIAREMVRDVYARYTHAGDRGDLAGLAACFTDTGVLEAKGFFRSAGRDEIAATLANFSLRPTKQDQNPPGVRQIVRHNVANLLFEHVSAERIEATAYFTVFHVDAPDHWGRYRDVLVPVGEGWLLSHRRVSIDGRCSDSPTALPNTAI